MAKQIQKPVSEEDIRSYEREWAAMMVHIWRENMLRLGVVRTKALYNSLTHSVTGAADQITIAHQFMLYGIYIARGVGRGYTRGNPGDLEFLDKSKPGGETDPAPVINDIAERIPSRGFVIVVSDLFTSAPDELVKALHHFNYRKHEIAVLHVMAEEELTFDFDGHIHFENLEGTDEMMLDAKSIRAGYLEQVNAFLKKVGDGVRKMGADYAPMNTKVPFDKALVEYLSRRRSGGR
jgi:hypothetical protein